MFNWINTKINNQFIKVNKIIYIYKVNRFKKKFKSCGIGFYVRFPICLEGQQNITIGNNVGIAAFVHMWGHGKIVIGNDCMIASHVSINSVTHDSRAKLYRSSVVEKAVNIGNNVWIGTHAVILPGITIGDNAIVGAGALVNKDVPAGAIVGGVPFKIIRYISD